VRRFVVGDVRARRIVLPTKGDGVVVSQSPGLTVVDER
jgi:hypothetical protein